jgi:hypothetical protein
MTCRRKGIEFPTSISAFTTRQIFISRYMPKFIIHIGPTKTGSKYLQSLLFHSRGTLRSLGIDYPDIWWSRPDEIMHAPLRKMLREKRHAEVKDSFRELSLTGCRIIVLSGEGLDNLTPEEFEVLRDALGGNSVEFIYYCRRWCERIPSLWKQSIQMGGVEMLPQYYQTNTGRSMYMGSVNYSLVWTVITKIFGRKSLKFVSYSNMRDRNIDLFRHFTTTFLDWSGEIRVPNELIMDHESPNAFDTEIIRALNCIEYQSLGRHSPNMRIKFNAMRSSINSRTLEGLMAAEVAQFEISDAAEEFRLSRQEMAKYSDCLVSQAFSRQPLFELGSTSTPYVRGDYLLNDRAGQEIRDLYERLDKASCDATNLF